MNGTSRRVIKQRCNLQSVNSPEAARTLEFIEKLFREIELLSSRCRFILVKIRSAFFSARRLDGSIPGFLSPPLRVRVISVEPVLVLVLVTLTLRFSVSAASCEPLPRPPIQYRCQIFRAAARHNNSVEQVILAR